MNLCTEAVVCNVNCALYFTNGLVFNIIVEIFINVNSIRQMAALYCYNGSWARLGRLLLSFGKVIDSWAILIF